ncbi:hypothetical protein CDCA_CDCA16G4224 [Cyanidium caldarium]|uniref:Galactokinase n=1 Tax=Cyanidium caldarium TaxID=2771 RepID=A0AAV9J123_CYACA|nr:hypothetical protein CDCA_CDCA16G4224 [Cyanidium caldarium]
MTVLEAADTAALLQRGVQWFSECFPEAGRPEVAAAAPGRVNLIGEHTDYNDGFVLPMALRSHEALLVGKRRADELSGAKAVARVVSETHREEPVEFALQDIRPGSAHYNGPSWGNYVRGMASHFLSSGCDVPAFDAVVVSEVPTGGGVSSSAALEMATAAFLEALTGFSVDAVQRARWGQRVEHEFAGVPCGIMDQLISSAAVDGAALLIDCRDVSMTPVVLDDPETEIVVVNSNVKHSLADGEYGRRRAACERAASAMGVPSLRDADLSMLEAARQAGKLGDPADRVYERARHVIKENARVLEAVEALRQRSYVRFGQLMNESHESLRTDYEVSCTEIDVLVELARQVAGVYGSRITGGGFGGCTVTLVKRASVDALLQHIEQQYPKRTGRRPTCFVSRPGPGARPITLAA